MKFKRFPCMTVIVSCTLATIAALPALGQNNQNSTQTTSRLARYTVQDLGTLDSGTLSVAWGINERGDVEGVSTTLPDDNNMPPYPPVHAFRWRDGALTDLGTLGGPNSIANWRPSGKGQVGGYAETSSPDPSGENSCGNFLICLPVVWEKGGITPLPTVGGENGQASGFNQQGQVVGNAEDGTIDPTCSAPQLFHFKPVIWEEDPVESGVQELPTAPGDLDGVAYALNDKEQAIGLTGNCTTAFHSLLWQRQNITVQSGSSREQWTARDINSLGGSLSFPNDINDRGQVVGTSNLPGDTTNHAFLWRDGTIKDLGTLPGDVFSQADGINEEGQIVGISVDANGNGRAFLWNKGVMTDLNTLIPADSPLTLIEATGRINSRGEIAGVAIQNSTGEYHAFLATPCDQANPDRGCTMEAQTGDRPKVALPAHIRKLIDHQANRPYGSQSRRLWPK
jgi:probable HAF family extracellular repeat protein